MKLLICIDGSPHSQKVIEEAKKIASGCSLDQVTLLSIVEPLRASALMAASEAYPISRDELDKLTHYEENTAAKCDSFLSETATIFQNLGISAEVVVKKGHPADTIVKTAAEGGYDLIIMGSRGLSGLKKLLLGSVSNAVLQESPVSVMVVK